MAYDVLPFDRCKSFFSHIQSLVGKQDFQQWIQQHHVNTPSGNIILDHWIKTCNVNERAVLATALPKQNNNNLLVELGHPSEAIMRSTSRALRIQVTSMFNPCEDCALAKAKQQQKGCTLLAGFWGKALLWYQLPIYSNFWWKVPLFTGHRWL